MTSGLETEQTYSARSRKVRSNEEGLRKEVSKKKLSKEVK